MAAQRPKSYITHSAYEQLIQICRDAKPIEACGIVVSAYPKTSDNDMKDEHIPIVNTIIPLTNTHIDPTHSFSFDPAEWTAIYYDMQKNRQTLVGLFHSHPRTEAVPSPSDSEGFLPSSELSYWIVSLQHNDAPHVQPYRRTQGEFFPLQLVLT